jgi:PTH1 family peptidyl-tRNA hydrolase
MTSQTQQQDQILAVIGLGNPGKEYEKTRHNAGFRVLDQLIQGFSVPLQERKFRASWGLTALSGRKVLFCKPLTYMNRSGEAVCPLLAYFTIPSHQILVIHDDLDLDRGRIRLARRGGSGGHRGVTSIMDHLKSQDFPRLKLGIGRPLHQEPVEAYVLQPPYGDELPLFEDMIRQGERAVRAVLEFGLDRAMNDFNT